MTRSEAAKICQSIKFLMDKEDYSEEVEEALNMAIAALKQLSLPKIIIGQGEQEPCDKRTDKRTETHACDCISRQDAIDAVKTLKSTLAYDSDFAEAKQMAIEALEKEETLQNLTKPNKSDLISRQAAIDAITNTGSMVAYHDASQSVLFGSAFRQNEIIGIINALPSAEPKTGEWISVSERLPSDGGNYLITVADLRLGHIGEHTVAMADFYAKEKKWNSVVDVYAWMPLPEPYEESDE